MKINTGEYAKNGKEIKLGDVLKGNTPLIVVVSWNIEMEDFAVQAINCIYGLCPLKTFLELWTDIEILGNIVFVQR